MHSGNRRSIAAMLLAVGFFSLMDAVMKLLAAHYPPAQVTALRGLTALPLVAAYVFWRRGSESVWRVRWPLHLVRGVIMVFMLVLFAYALRTLPMAEAYTIFFVAPLMITVLSIPVLKERVHGAHWWAIGVGFVGVVVALRPQQGVLLSLGALAVLGAASCYAVSAILGRVLTRTDSNASLLLWSTSAMAVGGSVLAFQGWVPLLPTHGWLLLALAVTGFAGQLAITEAFRHGQAAVVAPLEYTALAWAVVLDWLLWHTLPDRYTLLGGALVIGSGLYMIRRERRRQRESTQNGGRVQDAVLPP